MQLITKIQTILSAIEAKMVAEGYDEDTLAEFQSRVNAALSRERLSANTGLEGSDTEPYKVGSTAKNLEQLQRKI